MKIEDQMTKEQRALEMALGTVGYEEVCVAERTADGEYEWTNGGKTIVLKSKYGATLCGFVIAKGLPDPFCFNTPEAAIAYGLELQAEQREIAKAAGLL